ncbi:MAG: transcriptional regulator GutM [Defluviitaleaceae bacterium]|nr:transcriptional regulator GutM [Defluviitaleaceae bacterium]
MKRGDTIHPFVVVIILIVFANFVQAFLFRKQMKVFNELFYELRKNGNVLVGKYSGLFKAGSIVIFQLEDTTVKEAYFINGRSIFAKPKQLESAIGKDINGLVFDNPSLKNAYENALEYM